MRSIGHHIILTMLWGLTLTWIADTLRGSCEDILKNVSC